MDVDRRPPGPGALACLLLAGRVVASEVAPLSGPELWALLERVPDAGALMGCSAQGLAGLAGTTLAQAHRLARLLEPVTALVDELENLRRAGIQTLCPVDSGYPGRLRDRLGDRAPAALHVAGPTALLQRAGVGIVGSRQVSAQGARLARRAAGAIATSGRIVVSGAARGVDQVAMGSALAAEGSVVGFVAGPLAQALATTWLGEAVEHGLGCLCTPARPDAPFTPARALARNRLVYGLADFTLVVASDAGSGGTWGGATECLRRRWAPVAVWRGPGEGPGNPALERLGAHPLSSLEELASLAGLPLPGPPPGAVQLSLSWPPVTGAGGQPRR